MVWFKREYRNQSIDSEPRWHIGVHDYDKKVVFYREYVALCGYTLKNPWLRGGKLSYAKRRPVNQTCKKCAIKAEKETARGPSN